MWIKLLGWYVACMRLLLWVTLVGLVAYELKTSRIQAAFFSHLAPHLTFWVGPGASTAVRFPAAGPSDERRGYVHIPRMVRSLQEQGYAVAAQARFSPLLINVTDAGLFTPYHEKDQAGLQLFDRHGRNIFSFMCPSRIYPSFEAIPSTLVKSLLFIENRELLDFRYPYRNPAIDWRRLANAAIHHLLINGNGRGPGGSTLATQIEKFRHSPEGRTSSVSEKFLQMGSATLRAYLDGPVTLDSQCRIIREYVNTIPLGAFPGYGEIIGLGDGLWAWYSADFDAVNRYLSCRLHEHNDPRRNAWGLAFKQVLSLFIAQRRPKSYLRDNLEALESRTEQYLGLLEREGIISTAEYDAALRARLELRRSIPRQYEGSFLERKTAYTLRSRLLSLLDIPQFYVLDRCDIAATSSIDAGAQEDITWFLHQLKNPSIARDSGLYGEHMLQEQDPNNIVYSCTLYERTDTGNMLRIQTDNYEQPLNINESIKLELGSTAKLRTLITYLEIITELYRSYVGRDSDELMALAGDDVDDLTRWATTWLARAGQVPLSTMLDAALDRMYSAHPGESFFTGGGLHRFENFNPHDDNRTMTVREAFHKSVNLVFIRIMRDIVRYYIVQRHASLHGLRKDHQISERRDYLVRFAEQEGKKYLTRFYQKYRSLPTMAALQALVSTIQPSPIRLAVIFRSVLPEADMQRFAAFVRDNLPQSELSEQTLATLYRRYTIDAYSLVDRAYLARVHPLELWTVAYLHRSPQATLSDIIRDSTEERQAVYQWLFKTRNKEAQDVRIQIVMENEAFQEIHRSWKRLGYPFDSLVPSYATAIGSSADRPAALAELVGIILNDGVLLPTLSMQQIHIAPHTPYETLVVPAPRHGEQVLVPEIARAVRRELQGVVQRGTATKLRGVFCAPDGTPYPIGGKTGTGDNRYDVYNSEGVLVKSRVVNRTATFVFFIGDRFFGTITAYVEGPDAARYRFTSSLPVQVLKAMAPKLMPLLSGSTITSSDDYDVRTAAPRSLPSEMNDSINSRRSAAATNH
ncbi:MAG: transglycosylase domain-containing protein [Desulfobacterota bacterium]|nr:transglycosylase domain-containing protein [Thermodesulfobacteriota bacterium]